MPAGADPDADAGISGVVLAGGASRRFGSDKLSARVDGQTLLAHAARALGARCDEVVAVLAPEATRSDLPGGAVVVHDAEAHLGPLSGLASGLAAATGAVVLVVGGDMPWVRPAVADLLIAALDDGAVSVAALGEGDRLRPLPIALRRAATLAAAERLLAAGERRLRALLEVLPTAMVPEERWRALDPEGWALRDVDEPADLPDRGPELE